MLAYCSETETVDVEELKAPAIILALTVFIARNLWEWAVASNKHLKEAIEENTLAIKDLSTLFRTQEIKVKNHDEDIEGLKKTVRKLRQAEIN